MEMQRDRIRTTFNHAEPESIPVNVMGFEDLPPWLEHFGVESYAELCRVLGTDAFPDAPPVYRGPEIRPGLDIWRAAYSWTGASGAGFSSARGGYPLGGATTVQEAENHPWPQAADFDYSPALALRAVLADRPLWIRPLYIFPADDADQGLSVRARRAEWIPVLCTLFNLFGLEKTLIDMAVNPGLIEAALAHIEEFILAFCSRMIVEAGPDADIFWFGDDFAGQEGMLLSPELWRRLLKPVYRKVFALARSHGMKVWFHSCGTFRPVLPDLIDIGMDIWETVQVHLPGNDPVDLKREYGRYISFYGGISTQWTLPHGTPEDVRAEVRERIRVLGKGGGYFCSSDHTIMPDVPFENVTAMIDEARKWGS